MQHKKITSRIFLFEPFANSNGFNFDSCLYKNQYPDTLSYLKAR